MRRSTLVLTVMLVVAGLVVGALALPSLIARWLPPVVGRAPEAVAAAADEQQRLRERVLQLSVANVDLSRRLRDHEDVIRVVPDLERARRAPVLARSVVAGRRLIEVGLGRYDGVARDQAVVAGWSLVGLVVGEDAGRSLVRQCTDRESRVPAHLVALPDSASAPTVDVVAGGEVVALGVCAGVGSPATLELRMVEDRPGFTVVPGMIAVTAGGPGTVPPGLALGVVHAAHRQAHSDHWHIELVPLRRAELEAEVAILAAGGS
ncbi:MAG: rod shape-determining protein MreC [Planctomycetota bacterium]|jgi:cell shape-determining protein MreC